MVISKMFKFMHSFNFFQHKSFFDEISSTYKKNSEPFVYKLFKKPDSGTYNIMFY